MVEQEELDKKLGGDIEPKPERKLDDSIEMLFNALVRLDTETENNALREWCKNVCKPEYAVVDGLVANFVAEHEDQEYAKKLLKVIK